MLKKLGVSLTLVAFCTAVSASQYITSGLVTTVRIHSMQNQTVSVRGVTSFKLDTALSGGCLWLLIAAEDKQTLAHFLAARSVGKPVTVYYINDSVPPWGDAASCWVTVVDS